MRSLDERKLQMLHRAARLEDLKIPPNNRLEALKGDRTGQYSIRPGQGSRSVQVWPGQAWASSLVPHPSV